MYNKTLAIVAMLIGIVLPSVALTQVPKGMFRLSVDSDIIDFYHGSWNPGGPADWDVTKLELGFGNPNVGFGIGGTIIDGLAIGVRMTISWSNEKMKPDEDSAKDSDEGSDDTAEQPDENVAEDAADDVMAKLSEDGISTLRWGVLPYIEYAFLTRVIRPFIIGTLGLEGETLNEYGAKSEYWDFFFALGGGLHIFPSPSFSIDGTVLIGFSAGGGQTADEEDFTRILFRLSLLLGVSGWF